MILCIDNYLFIIIVFTLLHFCEALFYCEPVVLKQLGAEDATYDPEGVLRSEGGVAETCWRCAVFEVYYECALRAETDWSNS